MDLGRFAGEAGREQQRIDAALTVSEDRQPRWSVCRWVAR